MKLVDRGTWTETVWEVGDLVRLKKDEYGDISFRGRAGEFGRVTDARDNLRVELTLNGYARGDDGLGGSVSLYRSDLEPWVREPRDEPALAANLVSLLTYVAFTTGTAFKADGSGYARLDGKGIVPVYGDRRHSTNMTVVADALPYVGDGKGTLDTLPGIDWNLNADGHALLDRAGIRKETSLAGGGQAFKMSFGRDGVFRAQDLGTGRSHAFAGVEGARLLEANRKNVGWLTDGKMPTILRCAMDYPRTLRIDATADPTRGVTVIETTDDALEVRRGGETFAVCGEEAAAIRNACSRVQRLALWIAARPKLLEASPAPGMR